MEREKEREKRKEKPKHKSPRRSRTRTKSKSKPKSDLPELSAQTAMFDQKLEIINGQIKLLRDKEAVVADKYRALKNPNNNQKDIVNKKVSNKDTNYPFSTYEKCFIAKAVLFSRLILPTILIRIECDGIIHGPFRALLDSGAQPNLISHTLFTQLRCSTSQSARKLLGVASTPLTIKRKMALRIRPWFPSDHFVDDTQQHMEARTTEPRTACTYERSCIPTNFGRSKLSLAKGSTHFTGNTIFSQNFGLQDWRRAKWHYIV